MTDQVTELEPGDIQRPESAPTAPARAPAAEEQPEQMSAEQQAGAQKLTEMRQRFLDPTLTGMQRDQLTQQINDLAQHVVNGAPKPGWYGEQKPDPRLTDLRPHDPTRAVFEAAAKPANAEQMKAAVDTAVVQGVRRELAQEAAAVCGELQLSEGHTKGILDRVRAHHGAKLDAGPDSSFAVLSEAEVSEYASEASRLLGSSEKLAELSARAREFLAARGVLEKFDKGGLTQSSLAFDPKLLHTLAMAADMAGIPRGKR